ncbi:MAG: hypothetical protein LBU39_02995 [Desulfobulbaceae bacterium]|jgi:phenylalanyl-tRNA synthetase alpha chain|nr:hypothetical protein [Desulfobulbaceae bacterium]
MNLSETQKKRLRELGGGLDAEFADAVERDAAFKREETRLKKEARSGLEYLRSHSQRPGLCRMEAALSEALIAQGFVQVTTPTIVARSLLAKMGVDDEHDLFAQVFRLDDKRCLRPMLAPNLYSLLQDLTRLWPLPTRIFEIGSCFRKESQGAGHLNEFTMLNLVEWGMPEADKRRRLGEMAQVVLDAAGLSGWRLQEESSVVYGDTVDVMLGDVELASGAFGPHVLDGAWGLTGAWMGLGFGLERLVMLKEGRGNVRAVGKSLSYLDGARLNI